MPLEWLGSLEPRMSPLAQVLSAFKPAAEQLGTYFAQAPDRETQMVKTFLDFYSNSSPVVRRQLEASPRFSEMVALAERRLPGSTYKDPLGQTRFVLSGDQISKSHANALQGYTMLPDDQRQSWEAANQPLLQAMAEEGSPYVMRDSASGLYRVTPSYEQELERKKVTTEIGKAEAETEKAAAEAYAARASVDQVWAQIENEKDRIGVEWAQIDVQRERIKADIDIALKQMDLDKEKFMKQFGLDEAKFEEFKAQYAKDYALKLATFEEDKARWAKEYGLSVEELGLRKQEIANNYAIAMRQMDQQSEQFMLEYGLSREEFEESKKQYANDYALRLATFEDDKYRWAKQYNLSVQELELSKEELAKNYALGMRELDMREKQFELTFGLDREKFEESKRQYAEDYALRLKMFEDDRERWAKQFGLEVDKFELDKEKIAKDFMLAQVSIDQRWKELGLQEQDLAQRKQEHIDNLALAYYQFDKQLEQNADQFNRDLDYRYKALQEQTEARIDEMKFKREELEQRKYEFGQNFMLATRELENKEELTKIEWERLGLSREELALMERELGLKEGELALAVERLQLDKNKVAADFAVAMEQLRLQGLELDELMKDNEFKRNILELQTKIDAMAQLGALAIDKEYKQALGQASLQEAEAAVMSAQSQARYQEGMLSVALKEAAAKEELNKAITAETFMNIAAVIQSSPYLSALPANKKADAAKSLLQTMLKGVLSDEEISDVSKYFFEPPKETKKQPAELQSRLVELLTALARFPFTEKDIETIRQYTTEPVANLMSAAGRGVMSLVGSAGRWLGSQIGAQMNPQFTEDIQKMGYVGAVLKALGGGYRANK